MKSTFQPEAIIGHEGSSEVAITYAYILRPLDDRDAFFLTSHNEPISISGIPAEYNGRTDPQVFTPNQITHDAISLTSTFTQQQFLLKVPYNDPLFNPYIFTVPSNIIEITVLRISSDIPEEADNVWKADTYMVQVGILKAVNINGEIINLTCSPEPLHMALGLPRIYFNRTCQHALYGAACGVTQATFTDTGQLALSLSNPRTREIVIDGMTETSANVEFFTAGLITHLASGEIFMIYASSYDFATGTLTATIGHWSESFTEDDEIEISPGCRRTTADCETKFSNLAAFGGFPHIPNRNPTTSNP